MNISMEINNFVHSNLDKLGIVFIALGAFSIIGKQIIKHKKRSK